MKKSLQNNFKFRKPTPIKRARSKNKKLIILNHILNAEGLSSQLVNEQMGKYINAVTSYNKQYNDTGYKVINYFTVNNTHTENRGITIEVLHIDSVIKEKLDNLSKEKMYLDINTLTRIIKIGKIID